MHTPAPIRTDLCKLAPHAAAATLPPAEAAVLTGVSKIFGTFAAVRNLSLTLKAGSITVILGENGAGKSTLLRLLAGLTTPTRGTVDVLGEPAEDQRGRVAYMSHAPMLYDELTARENLDYFAALYREEGCDCVASPEMALRAVGLDPHLPRPIAQYSQGMRQRASLARVLQSDPELLLLDEPFSNLDVQSAQEMVALLADFVTWPRPAPTASRPNPAARSVILTTHQAHLAEPIADLILTMRQGSAVSLQPREAAR
jgi:ABC-type multidrug transport system ATPase subunit